MFAEERKEEILKVLKVQGKVKTLELSEKFNVSEPTIRRDISDLEKAGRLIRTHGGALPLHENDGEPTFVEKIDKFSAEKAYIGKIAAAMITEGKNVILDGGTTTLEILKNITASDVTVITNSIEIAEYSEKMDNINLILLGGQFRWNTRALVGPITERILRTFRADIAFVGMNGIDINSGMTTQNLMEATTKQVMMEVSKTVFVVADHSKFGKRELCVVSNLENISGIITDQGISESVIEEFENKHVDVLYE